MSISESTTVIKRIVPYLNRRGFDLQNDLHFEEPTDIVGESRKGFIDILIKCGSRSPQMLIEAKRDGTKLTAKHVKQALEYGASIKCLLVAVTNGQDFSLFNATTQKPLKINSESSNIIPNKADLIKTVIPQLKADPSLENITIPKDKSLPYRPGVPLSKLNHLIKQCHNLIRKIEKNEEHAFADFSKILFLKLLEEKWDIEGLKPPYSYTFHELAALPKGRADQVKTSINSMIDTIVSKTKYGEVLADPIRLKKNEAYLALVQKISSISWSDCDLDSKGAAFEYFVRATLKGKKLGQYFTPRPLVSLMLHLGKYNQIIENSKANLDFKVLDPACGTGGFLVHGMQMCIQAIEDDFKSGAINKTLYETALKRIKSDVFFGVDAHEGVACSAKMNMIIAGDGHSNIQCEDALKLDTFIPKYKHPVSQETSKKAQLILSNPPFGTSESDSLTSEDLGKFPLKSSKGQSLFIQQMILNTDVDGLIVTVIDEGVLNTSSYKQLRELILRTCYLRTVIELPEETFKPNKINVKSSVLVLQKRAEDDDLEDEYPIAYIKLNSLGYESSGETIRGFDYLKLIKKVTALNSYKMGDDLKITEEFFSAFKVYSTDIFEDTNRRFDLKYWDFDTLSKVKALKADTNTVAVKDINLITTARGSSPNANDYVSQDEGFALVVKSGSNISKNGQLITGGDYIEESIYKDYEQKKKNLIDGDILVASTGDGTLGKCCVYRTTSDTTHAIADGHVTVIRVDQKKIYPEYLCDYIRAGFGAVQINRLFTGSTGLIEIQPEEIDRIMIPSLPSIKQQRDESDRLRKAEANFFDIINDAELDLKKMRDKFFLATSPKF